MNKFIFPLLIFSSLFSYAQSYAPAAGQEGSTAIHKDDNRFLGWATGIELHRGYLNIEDKAYEINGSNKVSFGDPENALGKASGITTDVVSLGDSGVAILIFEQPIFNGPGYDFAVFENGFSDDYLEFAHVEVSSDGINFFRFPSHSEVQTDIQVNGFGATDTRRINNLAGKYRSGYGTPFDLEELSQETELNINAITHIKLIDVIGSIGDGGTVDSYGNKINDPFPTPFESGGFDLEGVGVIHQVLSTSSLELPDEWKIYPNPSDGYFTLKRSSEAPTEITVYNQFGRLVSKESINGLSCTLQISVPPGIYYIHEQGTTKRERLVIF